MATSSMAGLVSLTSKLLGEQEQTNELLQKLTEKFEHQGGPGQVPTDDEPQRSFAKSASDFGKSVLGFAASIIAFEKVATGIDRMLTRAAKEYTGGGLERGQAYSARMFEYIELGLKGIGPGAVNETRQAFESRGLFANAFDETFQMMALRAQTFGLEVTKILDPAIQMVASGAGKNITETFGMVTKFSIEMARRGLNARKAVDSLNQVPDLVTKFGSATDEQLMRIIETSTKLGISARKSEDALMGMSAKGFDGLIDGMASLQTVMPGLALDFNEMANVVEFGDQLDLQNYIQEAFGGMDFTKMGRTQRRMMQDMFGFSIDEMQRMAQGEDVVGAVEQLTQDATDPLKEGNELLRAISNFTGKILDKLGAMSSTISGLLVGISALLAAVLLPIGGLLATLKVGGLINRSFLPGKGMVGKFPGASVFAGPMGLASATASQSGHIGMMGAGLKGASQFGKEAVADFGRIGGAGRAAKSFGKTALGVGRIGGPLFGLMGAGFGAYDEWKRSGDLSRTISAGAGSGLGTVAGMAGGSALGTGIGAGIGTLILPGVGTAIGGMLGGMGGTILGSMFGEKSGSWLGKKFNDIFLDRGKDFGEQMPAGGESGVPSADSTAEFMESIVPLSDETNDKLMELIENEKATSREINDKLERLNTSSQAVVDSIRSIKVQFPDSVRLTGNSVEFAGKVMRDAYDHSVRNQ